MRTIAIVLVIVIGLMILATATSNCLLAGAGVVSIGTLDVCHGSAAGINVDIPYSIDDRFDLFPPLIVSILNIVDVSFRPLLISLQDERPPRS